MTLRKWLHRRWKRFLYRRGWRYCPVCRKFAKIKWVKDVVLHEDEPPMFFHWTCSNCGARTPIAATGLTQDAVKSLGYKDFDDYVGRILKREKKETK